MKGGQEINFVGAIKIAAIYYKPYPQHDSYNEFVSHYVNNDTKKVASNSNNEYNDLLCSISETGKLHYDQWIIVKCDDFKFHGIIT